MRRAALLACAWACLVLAVCYCVTAEDYSYDYSYGYDDESYDEMDDYNYYGNDDADYYDEYGFYADGYDGYYDYDEYEDYKDDAFQVCLVGSDGKAKLSNGTATCDMKLAGVDKQAPKLSGGIDGVYKLIGCHAGRPMYKREKSPAGEDRVLFYSDEFGGDWDVSNGSTFNDKDILMYGGNLEHVILPLFVKKWHMGVDLVKGVDSDDYMEINGTFKCADGKVYKPPKQTPATQKVGPVLTDEEFENKYRYIYEKYGRRPDPNPTLNFTFVLLLVMIGLTIVLGIPYFLMRKKNTKGYQPVATSFTQIIQQSKKKQSGHIH